MNINNLVYVLSTMKTKEDFRQAYYLVMAIRKLITDDVACAMMDNIIFILQEVESRGEIIGNEQAIAEIAVSYLSLGR